MYLFDMNCIYVPRFVNETECRRLLSSNDSLSGDQCIVMDGTKLNILHWTKTVGILRHKNTCLDIKWIYVSGIKIIYILVVTKFLPSKQSEICESRGANSLSSEKDRGTLKNIPENGEKYLIFIKKNTLTNTNTHYFENRRILILREFESFIRLLFNFCKSNLNDINYQSKCYDRVTRAFIQINSYHLYNFQCLSFNSLLIPSKNTVYIWEKIGNFPKSYFYVKLNAIVHIICLCWIRAEPNLLNTSELIWVILQAIQIIINL